MILDLFAGPGGWSEGLRLLDPELHAFEVGMEWDSAACATRAAAGHKTIQCDIARYPTAPFVGKVTGLIASPPCQDFSVAGKRAGVAGDRGQLVSEVMRWTVHLEPEWIACEQVPPVLPIWQDYAAALRAHGYSTWCGILNAADYGVPQTRQRAFLIASRVRPALPPEPTHAKDPAPSLFGPEQLPWVSMAAALGWDHGRVGFPRLDDLGTSPDGYRERDWRDTDEPAFALTEKARSWVREVLTLGDRYQENAAVRTIEEPAPTILASADNGNTRWAWEDRFVRGPARDPEWPLSRPSTTLAGDPRVAQPGHKHDDRSPDSPGRMEGSIRLEPAEALVLQSFPADYPVQGTKTKKFEQIGNAVPPRLAAHVIAAITGRPYQGGTR